MSTSTKIPLREAYGEALARLGDERDDFITVDADMCGATFVEMFRTKFPDRHIRFGIAEQNMMSAAAGLSTTGVIPIVNTMAVFASMRALEQLRTSIAMSRFNVKIVASHQGVDVGQDGPTHQCIEDISIIRAIPNMVLLAPTDPVETEAMLRFMLDYDGPVYLRTGRSPVPTLLPADYSFQLGQWPTIRDGDDVTLVGVGTQVERVLLAAEELAREGISAQVLSASSLKPIDEPALTAKIAGTGCAVTVEDHNIHGGVGSILAEILARHEPMPIEFAGVPDRFGDSGFPEELFAKLGFSIEDIVTKARAAIERKGRSRA
jgi:transketolase